MRTKVYDTRIQAPVEEVWEFYTAANAAKLLTPPEAHLELEGPPHGITLGAVLSFTTKTGTAKRHWTLRVDHVERGRSFRLVALKSPFKSWTHTVMLFDEQGDTLVEEKVEYQWKSGPVGAIANQVSTEEKLDHFFKHRGRTARHLMESSAVVINEDLIGSSHEYVSDMDLSGPTNPPL